MDPTVPKDEWKSQRVSNVTRAQLIRTLETGGASTFLPLEEVPEDVDTWDDLEWEAIVNIMPTDDCVYAAAGAIGAGSLQSQVSDLLNLVVC